ncbi:MAG: molybdopterin-dependent oxidoreductase [Candidatus Latescibacteria bacterium]|nr:molybdopterin-dependent oxidoreductase [Candidatus Latescibacterota bacterium]
MAEGTVKLTIDGREVEVPRGTNVVEAAKKAGVEIPHYCYHPKLPIAGNCRMCLVSLGMPKMTPERKPELDAEGKPVIAFMPAPQIGCNTMAAEGMVVQTRTPAIIKARQGVMEFLLINHPLDCPICDQAGECRLQEFAVDYGKGASRFIEEKVHKPKQVELNAKITLDNERCIMCSRCERFMRHVAGQDCLGFVQRGSHTELTCYPGQEPKTNYDLNIVDICPVGALTSTDFRFRQRAWFLKETKSICPSCATGCNTVVAAREGEVLRQTPRDNEAVNQCWMCDYGRLNYKFINDPQRLQAPLLRQQPVEWQAALGQAVQALRGARGAVAAVGSARATTEELFLFNRLTRQVLGASLVDCVPRQGEADHLLLNADRNPNSRGASLTGVAAEPLGSQLGAIAQGIGEGRIKALLVLGEDVTKCGIGPELLAKLEALVVIDILPNATVKLAQVVLPGASFAEKRGSFINAKGRLQRFNAAIQPAGEARPDWQILAALLRSLDPAEDFSTLEGVFAQLAQEQPVLAGLSLSRIGDQGIQLDTEAAAAPVAAG